MVPVGLTLQPDAAFLDLLGGAVEDAAYYEVAPETLWYEGGAGRLVENGFFRRFAALRARTGKPLWIKGRCRHG